MTCPPGGGYSRRQENKNTSVRGTLRVHRGKKKLSEKMIANTPKPPYYAVIFTNIRTEVDEAYAETAEEMVRLAEMQEGYLGHESVRDGLGITISYWASEKSILSWKQQTDHLLAQRMGREKWYETYKTRICLVERDYGFIKEE